MKVCGRVIFTQLFVFLVLSIPLAQADTYFDPTAANFTYSQKTITGKQCTNVNQLIQPNSSLRNSQVGSCHAIIRATGGTGQRKDYQFIDTATSPDTVRIFGPYYSNWDPKKGTGKVDEAKAKSTCQKQRKKYIDNLNSGHGETQNICWDADHTVELSVVHSSTDPSNILRDCQKFTDIGAHAYLQNNWACSNNSTDYLLAIAVDHGGYQAEASFNGYTLKRTTETIIDSNDNLASKPKDTPLIVNYSLGCQGNSSDPSLVILQSQIYDDTNVLIDHNYQQFDDPCSGHDSDDVFINIDRFENIDSTPHRLVLSEEISQNHTAQPPVDITMHLMPANLLQGSFSHREWNKKGNWQVADGRRPNQDSYQTYSENAELKLTVDLSSKGVSDVNMDNTPDIFVHFWKHSNLCESDSLKLELLSGNNNVLRTYEYALNDPSLGNGACDSKRWLPFADVIHRYPLGVRSLRWTLTVENYQNTLEQSHGSRFEAPYIGVLPKEAKARVLQRLEELDSGVVLQSRSSNSCGEYDQMPCDHRNSRASGNVVGGVATGAGVAVGVGCGVAVAFGWVPFVAPAAAACLTTAALTATAGTATLVANNVGSTIKICHHDLHNINDRCLCPNGKNWDSSAQQCKAPTPPDTRLSINEVKNLTNKNSEIAQLFTQLKNDLGQPKVGITVSKKNSLSKPEYVVQRNKEGYINKVIIKINDNDAKPDEEALWYMFGQVLIDYLQGPLTGDDSCRTNATSFPRPIHSEFLGGEQSKACFFRENFVEWFVAYQMNRNESSSARISALNDWEPVGAGRRLISFFGSLSDYFHILITDYDLGEHVDNHIMVSIAAHECAATQVDSCRDETFFNSTDEAIDKLSQCESLVLGDDVVPPWKSFHSEGNCDEKMRILCRGASVNNNLEVSYNNRVVLTQNSYPLKLADIACEVDPKVQDQDYVSYVGSASDLFSLHTSYGNSIPDNVANMGTGSVCGSSNSCSNDGTGHSNKRAREDDDIANGLHAAKRARLTASLIGKDEDYTFLEVHSINTGAGACQVVQCVNTNNKGHVTEVDALLFDCGTRARTHKKVKYALDVAGVSAYLQEAYFFEDKHPIIAVSHPDADHFSHIAKLLPVAEPHQIWLGGDATQFGGHSPLRDYISNYKLDRNGRQKPPGQIRGKFKKWLSYQAVTLRTPVNGLTLSGNQGVEDIQAWNKPVVNSTLLTQFPNCGSAELRVLNVNMKSDLNGVGAKRNANSAVLQLTYKHDGEPFYTAVLPGDALGKTEKEADELMDSSMSAYKHRLLISSHHGSSHNGSNGSYFYNLEPHYVFYSSGLVDGHPHEKVRDLYNKNDMKILKEHSLRFGAKKSGSNSYSYSDTTTSKAEYSTYSSGSLLSRVKVPKLGKNVKPVHIISTEK